jgi:predicted transcriptional regulator
MQALLSIKPKFVEKIFNGEKKFEFRKVVFANKTISTVIIYATMPVGKIVGEFEIDEIIEDNPNNLWNITKEFAGIEKNFFDKYFEGREKGFAIKIKDFKEYDIPINPIDFSDNFVAPQSFKYIRGGCKVIREITIIERKSARH